MHGLAPARKAFGQTPQVRVRLLAPGAKNALDRVRGSSHDALLFYALPEPVYETGTLLADPQGVFFKRGRRVFRLRDVRFDSMYHACRTTATVLLTRQGHARNVVVVLRSDPPEFNAINRVPDSRFVFFHVRSSLPCAFLGAAHGPGLTFSRHNPETVVLQCPPFKTGTYDKTRFVLVGEDQEDLCTVQGRRYHMGHGRRYYMAPDNRVLCPAFT
tara:strand:+ start:177 stop:821 length:645 start_codon:yes stop_codon:yes gene_type:complete